MGIKDRAKTERRAPTSRIREKRREGGEEEEEEKRREEERRKEKERSKVWKL